MENRTKKPPVSMLGEQFCIHSGKTFDVLAAMSLPRMGVFLSLDELENSFGGQIVATARLVGWVSRDDAGAVEHSESLTVDQAAAFLQSRWFTGPFGWCLDDVRPVQVPVACRGMMGMWPIPGNVLAQLMLT